MLEVDVSVFRGCKQQIGEPIAALMQKFAMPPLIERELLPVPKQAAS